MQPRPRFVTPSEGALARWEEAFGPVEILNSTAGSGAEVAGQLLWILTTLPDWQGEVRQMVAAGARVVVLSPTPEVAQGIRAICLGARGYAHMLATPELLCRIAAAVEAGGLWLGPELMRRLVAMSSRLVAVQNGWGEVGVQPEDRGLLLACLTPRERQVALAVIAGKANKEIAQDLGIVERTVKAHLASIFDKIGVSDRLHLALRLAVAQDDTVPL